MACWRRQPAKKREKKTQGGLKAEKLYRRVNKEILRQNNTQYTLYEGIRSELYLQGVQLFPTFALDEALLRREKSIFEKEIRPYLKAEPLDDARPRQKQLYLCAKLVRPQRKNAQFMLGGPGPPRFRGCSTCPRARMCSA